MRKRISDEIPCCGLACQHLSSLFGEQQRHCVKQHRWTAVDHVMRRDMRAILCRHTADLGSDYLHHSAFFLKRRLQHLQQRGVTALADQYAYLAPGKRLRAIVDHAERR